MNVSAVIVTRGDVDLAPVLDSLPRHWQKVVWDNSKRDDLAVYGRYAALEDCEHEVVFVQDDDVLLPRASINLLIGMYTAISERSLVANMPQRFRDTGFYDDHCLVGFGAMFHRDLPAQAFDYFAATVPKLGLSNYGWWLPDADGNDPFLRTCDIVFTGLTSHVLVDVPYTDREFASAPNRMWKQESHVAERTRMLELVRQARDA